MEQGHDVRRSKVGIRIFVTAPVIYFLSDAHIGSRALDDREEHQQRVVALLHKLAEDATAIYLLGDMFDYWFEYRWRDRSKAEYRPFLDALRRLTEQGIAVHYFVGNHDLWTFGELEKQTGVIMHREPCEAVLCGKTVWLGHGDGVVPSNYDRQLPPELRRKVRRFMRLRAFFHNPVAQGLFRWVPPHWGNAFGYGWARRSRMKELQHPCPYKGEAREELVLYAKEQEQRGNHHDYYIFGHRHIELDLQLTRNSRILILGDCWRLWTYACMNEKGEITLCTLEPSN